MRKAGSLVSRKTIRSAAVALLAAAAAGCLPAPPAHAQSPGEGPGGPVLVAVDPGDEFGRYYAEILRAEGLNEFAVASVGTISAQTLAAYRVVVLAETALSDAQAAALDSWVQGGGNLIAMRPDPRLAGLLGLGSDVGDLANGYMQVAPGRGITGETMQFHGTADRWTTASATAVATLYSDATTPTSDPAVTLRSVGAAGGQAAAFTYDLARSVVYTRQGNPAWAGDERDFALDTLIRSDDLFFGAKPGDVQPDWVDLDKVAIPQADEQQRLLANLVTQMSADRVPLPRFWYLPRGEKAAVVMTGDDHNNGGTAGQFDRFKSASPAGCSVLDWECIRATSYVFTDTPIPGAEGFESEGFEIALHLSTNCGDFTRQSLAANWATQLPAFRSAFPTLDSPATNRTHCIAWSDWAGEPILEAANGVRLDTNYYYWPGTWVNDRPGMFTGSGMPMRFADLDGSLIDVYQAATQLTDESNIRYDTHIAALLDGALGPGGYYGVFTANMHTDQSQHPGADAIVSAAKQRGVPVVSARQMLEWLDGRNDSSFGGVGFSGNRLQFSIRRGGPGARGLQAMLPVAGPTGDLSGVSRAGTAVATSPRTVKGIEYAVFDAAAGDYTATYGSAPPDPPAPPETTITDFTVNGDTARAGFSSDLPGAGFQCRVDGAAFSACASPAQYSGLLSGQHTFQVRAVAAGIPDPTPAVRAFTVLPATPPSNGEPPPGGGESGATPPSGGKPSPSSGDKPPGGVVLGEGPIVSDRVAPHVLLRTRRARVSDRGVVSLRATCPESEESCRVRLRLRLGRRYAATRTLTLAGGETRRFRLQLHLGRRLLARDGTLRVTAVLTARDAAGNKAAARTAVLLLAPRTQ
jgi:hypothetical protein